MEASASTDDTKSENPHQVSTYTRRGELKFDGKTDTLLDFRDHVQRKAEIEGGATMKSIALGDLGHVDPSVLTLDETEVYTKHLVTWQKEKMTTDCFDKTDDGKVINEKGKLYLASQVERYNYVWFSRIADATSGFEPYRTVILYEKAPVGQRVHDVWEALRSQYNQCPAAKLRKAKRAVTEVLIFPTTEKDANGDVIYRTWQQGDETSLAFNTYDSICDHYNRLCRAPDATADTTTTQPECVDDQKIDRWKLILDPHEHGYTTAFQFFNPSYLM